MTSIQKVIKYLAIAFAIFLTVTIISAILEAIYSLSGILGIKSNETTITEDMNETVFNNNIKNLEIDISCTNLTIKQGEQFKVETNNSNIGFNENTNKLEIKEKRHRAFNNYNNRDIIIYIPSYIELDKTILNSGAGEIFIETLTTKDLSFKLGAGKVKIENLNVSEKCNIEGGAGRLDILNGNLYKLDLDMGVGEINISSSIMKDSKIEAGIGNLNIDLLGNKDIYKIKAEKGLGSIKIDGNEIFDNQIYGNGENYIDVDGGIGNIKISFKNI